MEYNFLITGGYRPEKQNYTKYLVSISRRKFTQFFGDGHFCGGAIIKPNVVVTASHCIKRELYGLQMMRSVIVIAGTPNRLLKNPKTQIMKVKSYRIFDKDVEGESADLALIILQENIIIDNITTGILPLARKKPSSIWTCTVIGWGRIFEHGPMPAEVVYVDINIWDERRCRSYRFWEESLICAGVHSDPGRDSCAGDSGGPLICNDQLYGIVSFGIGCGTPGFPGFYTNVWRYTNWILSSGASNHRINYIL
ncbi:trypsin eta-like [Eurosta solidaginis]|uniref:trypsin eta-like n=1 Tax=Eurosta solidaginis TaxID=178769 RepID=UPI0035312A5F